MAIRRMGGAVRVLGAVRAVEVVWVVREGAGGPGTHWPKDGRVWVVRVQGGPGTHWQPLNTL